MNTKANMKFELQTIFLNHPLLKLIIEEIFNAGGRALLVGGAVRDLLLGLNIKDIDIEVHGLTVDQLELILKKFGQVSLVGKIFGVFRLHRIDVDWSLPRIDTAGRKPTVVIDPHMSMKDAFERRDLTINAMGIDLHSGEIIDPFNGMQDLKNKLLRAPNSQKFVEDPLRFYRVLQFIARFNMYPDETLQNLCKTMNLSKISRERIEQEFQKLFLRSQYPSLGFRWLKDIGRLDLLPELEAIVGVPQEHMWHPEGDVFEHSMQTLDAAAQMVYKDDQEKLVGLYASLCHDLGKAVTTQQINGVWKSYRHESEGVWQARRFLQRITENKDLIESVVLIVQTHMIPCQLIKPEVKLSAFKRLAMKLAPYVSLELLAKVCLADKLGRNPETHQPLSGSDPEIEEFLSRARLAHVESEAEKPILRGRDLLDLLPPGIEMGRLLKLAYEIQIEEEITDKDELKRRVFSV